MKHGYLLWSYPMVKAILNTPYFEGSGPRVATMPVKLETRRIITYRASEGSSIPIPTGCHFPLGGKTEDTWCFYGFEESIDEIRSPFSIGDIAIGRERWAVPDHFDSTKPSALPIEGPWHEWLTYAGDRVIENDDPGRGYSKWRPSIFLPRRFCRIAHEVTSIHPERIQDITGEGIRSEGISKWEDYSNGRACSATELRLRFRDLWEKINGRKEGCSWSNNPWVWVMKLRRLPKVPPKP